MFKKQHKRSKQSKSKAKSVCVRKLEIRLTPASWEPVSMSCVCCRAVCEGVGPCERGRAGDISPHSSILVCVQDKKTERLMQMNPR